MAITQIRGESQIMNNSIPSSKLGSSSTGGFLSGSDLDMTNGSKDATITGLRLPTNDSDAATKQYVDEAGTVLKTVNGNNVSPGNHSLSGFSNAAIINRISITTASTDWNLILYSKDNYSSDPIRIFINRNGNYIIYPNLPYEDKDATSELHYNFTDNGGSNIYSIEVQAQVSRSV